MATHTDSHGCSIAEYNERLTRLLDGRMDYRTYKTLRAIIVTAIIGMLYVYAIENGADATPLGYLAFGAILVANGLELGEIITVEASETEEE